MRKAILLTLMLLLGVSAHALEIKQEPKQIPPLSVHELLNIKKYKLFKIIIYPLFSEDGLTFSGFKLLIRINDTYQPCPDTQK